MINNYVEYLIKFVRHHPVNTNILGSLLFYQSSSVEFWLNIELSNLHFASIITSLVFLR